MLALNFIRRYVLGDSVAKSINDTSHHDGLYKYYRIPIEKYEDIRKYTISSYDHGEPLTLNEHAPSDRVRMYIDLDSNKNVNDEPYEEDALYGTIMTLQRYLSKKLRARIPKEDIIPQLTSSKTVFSWIKPEYDSEDRIDFSKIDEFTLFVLKSYVPETKRYSYHLIWPFQLHKRNKICELMGEFFKPYDDLGMLFIIYRYATYIFIKA